MSKNQNLEQLQRVLKDGPAKSAALLEKLQISQPTFSRLWASVKDGVVLGAGKARHYALRRPVPRVSTPIPAFQVSEDGSIAPIGNIEPLQGAFYSLMPLEGSSYRLYEGMPYFLRDLRPQGFLGRMEPGKNPELDLPHDILRWTDDHVLQYISRRSEHAVGDLILGNESYARYLEFAAKAEPVLIPESARAEHYPAMATRAMQGEPPGSSAGGKQPKFTAGIARSGAAHTVEHVIVKFSPHIDTASGRRWGDLLMCEHLALAVLARHGIAAARTAVLETGGRIFLEVVRFDRAGLKGRRPMATFAALDGDLGMMDQNWTAVARELGRLGKLSDADIKTVEILDLFGALIGNTDRHHGNMAVAWTLENKYQLLDAYDMLPMLYRPNTHGEIVEREWLPNLGARLELRHLPQCYKMAHEFWTAVLREPSISAEFKEGVAVPHIGVLEGLNPGIG